MKPKIRNLGRSTARSPPVDALMSVSHTGVERCWTGAIGLRSTTGSSVSKLKWHQKRGDAYGPIDWLVQERVALLSISGSREKRRRPALVRCMRRARVVWPISGYTLPSALQSTQPTRLPQVRGSRIEQLLGPDLTLHPKGQKCRQGSLMGNLLQDAEDNGMIRLTHNY